MLFHGLFTCSVAAGHISDSEHNIDIVYQQHSDHQQHHQSDKHQQATDEHDSEHQFHAHVSCLTAYAAFALPTSKLVERIKTPKLFITIANPQPPVPPPNSSAV